MAEKLKFVPVEIPFLNEEVSILAKELNEVVGKSITLDLTRTLRGKSIEAIFKIRKEGEKLVADVQRLSILPFYIRRMMRKGVDYVEDSFVSEGKDSKLHVKFFMISRKKIHRGEKKSLRDKAKEELTEYIKSKNGKEVLNDLLGGKIQKTIALKLKKIYPLSFFDVRDITIKEK